MLFPIVWHAHAADDGIAHSVIAVAAADVDDADAHHVANALCCVDTVVFLLLFAVAGRPTAGG